MLNLYSIYVIYLMCVYICIILTYVYIYMYTSDSLQPNGCKLSVVLTFLIYSTPIWRLVKLASREASIDYTALKT